MESEFGGLKEVSVSIQQGSVLSVADGFIPSGDSAKPVPSWHRIHQ
jgi:hypothetical protein